MKSIKKINKISDLEEGLKIGMVSLKHLAMVLEAWHKGLLQSTIKVKCLCCDKEIEWTQRPTFATYPRELKEYSLFDLVYSNVPAICLDCRKSIIAEFEFHTELRPLVLGLRIVKWIDKLDTKAKFRPLSV